MDRTGLRDLWAEMGAALWKDVCRWRGAKGHGNMIGTPWARSRLQNWAMARLKWCGQDLAHEVPSNPSQYFLFHFISRAAPTAHASSQARG